jgi:hypothetical protein
MFVQLYLELCYKAAAAKTLATDASCSSASKVLANNIQRGYRSRQRLEKQHPWRRHDYEHR